MKFSKREEKTGNENKICLSSPSIRSVPGLPKEDLLLEICQKILIIEQN
jgi:hypothetical protein